VNHFSKYGLEDNSDEFGPEDLLKAQQQQQLAKQRQQQQQQQQQGADAYHRKTTDASLIKSSANKLLVSTSVLTYNADADIETSTATPATTTSSGSLSTSSSGLGGLGSPVANGEPPTQGLLSPPPTHHLLPTSLRLRDSPSHLQQQVTH
jgi:hypothetical protein